MSSREPITNPTLGTADRAAVAGALRKGASRREVMAGLVAGGMSIAAAGAVVGRAEKALAQAPRKGGRLRVALPSISTADTVDPTQQSLSTDYSRNYAFYNGITTLDSTLTPRLELAEAIENEKATKWVIKLRKDVRFHDGSPLTAADVAYSLQRHRDPKIASKARALAAQMSEIKATGTHEVTIQLATPNADLPVVFGTPHFLIIKDGTTSFTTANGTGPYKVKEFTPGTRTIAVKNNEYWRPGKGHVEEIEIIGIPDESARANAMLSGDVQLIAAISPRLTRRIESTPGFSIFQTKAGGYNDLVIRHDSEPGRNPDFVMAMKLLQNRQQIVGSVFQGYAVQANDQPIDPSNRFYDHSQKIRPYDPEKAKFHLKKSGYENATFPLHAMTGTSMLDTALLVQQAAKNIGLNIDVKRMPTDGYWSNVWMKFPLTMGNINPRPSADILFTLFFKSDSAWNESAWKNERFDQLLALARAETDEAKRKAMYAEMQQLVSEHCGIGLPAFYTYIDAHSNKVKGLEPIPTGGLMGYNFAEHVWLDA